MKMIGVGINVQFGIFEWQQNNSHPNDIIIFKHRISKTPVMSIKHLSNKQHSFYCCQDILYSQNDGFSFQCGVIGIPLNDKTFDSVQLQRKFRQIMAKKSNSNVNTAADYNLSNIHKMDESFAKIESYFVSVWHFEKKRDCCTFGTNINNMWNEKIIYNTSKLKIKDRVSIVNMSDSKLNRATSKWNMPKGRVQYIGNTHFASGEMVGIMLDGRDSMGIARGGIVDGKVYFRAGVGKGLFVRRSDIIINQDNNNNNNNYGLGSLGRGSYNNYQTQTKTKEEEGEDDGYFKFKSDKDTIDVCVDKNLQKLTFRSNNSDLSELLQGISQKLDFENYEYFYALSSVKCECKTRANLSRFEFGVVFSFQG